MNKSLAATAGLVVSAGVISQGAMGVDFASKLMDGSINWAGTIKWGAILTGIGLGLYFLLNNGVFANENLEEGERGYRRRWGKIISGKKGRKVLMPGKKHFYVKHWYDVVVQSVRTRSTPETPDYDKPVRATYLGKNILYVLVVKWRVLDTDDAIYKSLTAVYQVNRAAEGSKALEHFVMNEVYRAVGRSLSDFIMDRATPLPVIKIDAEHSNVPAELSRTITDLEENYGVRVESIDPVLLAVAPEAGMRIRRD